ncbi:response regulator [Candidatus Poribacteria bacterium]|nr:response regulator [Candidatus Poribacteria bacterium]
MKDTKEKNAILLVDDIHDNLFVLRELINKFLPECEVLTAVNAEEGIKIALNIPLDGAIIDVQMPGMDGIDMCRYLKNNLQTKNIPIILITAHHTTSQIKAKGLSAGADDFLSKPIDNIELVAKIKVMLRIKNAETKLVNLNKHLNDLVKERTLQLIESEEKFRTLSNNIPGMVYRGNPDWNLEIILNSEDICGYQPEDFYSKKIIWKEMIYSDDREKVIREAECLVKKESKIVQEYRIIHKDGNIRWVEDHKIFYFKNNNSIGIDGVIFDVTEKRKLISQLIYAQKMELIGQIASGVSHDFNNILAAIMGHAYILKKKLETADTLNNVEHIITSTKKGSNLIENLLNFSREQPINLKLIEINKVIKDIKILLDEIINKNIKLNIELSGEDLTIYANLVQLEQILMNLITNAQHAMPDGGQIFIKTKSIEIDEKASKENENFKPGNYILITVEDTGVGIDEGIKSKIFEPFFTTKENGKGFGLGLAMVYWIVKQYNGFIGVESVKMKGTVFKIYIPRINSQ